MPALVNRGPQVVTNRQWTTALSPNAANDGWNYVAATFFDVPDLVEWEVIKDLTTAPVQTNYGTTTHQYPNILFGYYNQLRAANGRIFFPLFANAFGVYRPDTEDVISIGPFLESPPINPNASTIPYSGSFDTAGMLYFATQESANRPSCVVRVNPTTLAIDVLGYVGNATGLPYTTYGYYIAPDTGTSTKYIYIAYGQSPWQLWALEIVSGTATQLIETPNPGRVNFTNIAGQGWVANVYAHAGQPDQTVTSYWCLDGAIYPYTPGNPPPGGLARDVTPYSNPIVDPPELDISGGAGIVGWRNSGSSGPFDYVNFTVPNAQPVPLEMIVTAPDGVLIGAESYLGFVRYNGNTHTGQWFGAQSGLTIAQPLALYVPTLGVSGAIFMSGYPNGVLFQYDPSQPWQTYPSQINPSVPGYYGAGGTNAAIKYSGQPATPSGLGCLGLLAWSPGSSAGGRLYNAGTRERDGAGSGIGYWDRGTGLLPGTDASPLDTVQPQGVVALDGINRIVMSTNTLSGSGPAPLYVFDDSLSLVATQFPRGSTIANLGPIFPNSHPTQVCGAYISSGNLALYRWDVQSGVLAQPVVHTAFAGAIDCYTINQADGSIWIAVGNTLVRVDPDTLAVTNEQDISSIATLTAMAFYGTELYMSQGATLWSAVFPANTYEVDLDSGTLTITGATVDLEIDNLNTMTAGPGVLTITGAPVALLVSETDLSVGSGTLTIHGHTVTLSIGTDSGGWKEVVYPPPFAFVDVPTLFFPPPQPIIPPRRPES